MITRQDWLDEARLLFEEATRRETAELKALLCGIKTRFGLDEDAAYVTVALGSGISESTPLAVLIAFVLEGQHYLKLVEELEQ